MIGWINLSVESFICDSFGRDAWLKIIKEAHVDCNWVSSCPYPDKVTYDIVITGANILGVTVPQALEAYGQYFVNYVIKQGYTRLLQSLGSNIAEFLANLNNLHLHLSMGFPSMVAPAFRVEQVTATSLLLHYHSVRPALWPIVSGALKGASQVLYNHGVELEVIASREAGDCDHEIFRVTYPHQESLVSWDDHEAAKASRFPMTTDFFYELFPFHMVLDTQLRIVQVGSVMKRLFGATLKEGTLVSDTFSLRHPYIPFEYERMILECDSLYLFKALQTGLEFKGQMVMSSMPDGTPVLLFMGSPRVANLEEMRAHGLYLSDIPLHDMSRDFLLLAEQRQAEADLKERFEKTTVELRVANDQLEQATRWLDEEKRRSDALLYRMLPADIAQDLRAGRKVEAISYDEVTILFSDMVGFTTTSAKSTPEEVYNMLNELYDRFDTLIDDFPDVYKLETIGDAYFLVCNLTTNCEDHVDIVIDFAIRMQATARQVRNAQGEPLQLRVGIHTGPVVGGVLGAKTPRFSIYGDTVNVASRMESHGLPGKIHISQASYNRIVNKDKYAVRERGNISVKGRGTMTTYLIGGTADEWLLRHNSFDLQLDGAYAARGGTVAGLAGRDGSFVITASARSAENLNSSRSLGGMESIKEGDESRNSRPTLGPRMASGASLADAASATNSGGGGGVAHGSAHSSNHNTDPGYLLTAPGSGTSAPVPAGQAAPGQLPPAPPGGGSPAGHSGADINPARGSVDAPLAQSNSVRAVFARGGRVNAAGSPVVSFSAGSRPHLSALLGAGWSPGSGDELASSQHSFAINAASSGQHEFSGTGAEGRALMGSPGPRGPGEFRVEGSSGSFMGMGPGMVLARSATAKASPLQPAARSQGASASATPEPAGSGSPFATAKPPPTDTAALVAGPLASSSSGRPALEPIPSGWTSTGSATSPHLPRPSNSSTRSGGRGGSEAGVDLAPSPSGSSKNKGLASKIKNLFKK